MKMLLLNIYINWVWIIIFINILCLAQSSEKKNVGESYATSVIGMVKLLKKESQLIDNLNDYTNEMAERIQILKNSIWKMRLENEKAQTDQIQYLSNPLNAFSLIRRLHSDWSEWRSLMERPIGKVQMKFYDKLKRELPTKLDLNEACLAFERMQNIYDMKVKDIIQGKLNGKQYNASLNIFDIYATGKYFFKEKNYDMTIEWLQEAFHLIQNNGIISMPITFNEFDVLQLLAKSYMKIKNYSDALIVLDFALIKYKHNAKLSRMRKDVSSWLKEPSIKQIEEPSKRPNEVDHNNYKIGCNGQFVKKKKSNLHCHYNTTATPFLRLAPFKMEILSINPYIVLFHDVLSRREIHEFQTAAAPKLERAKTYEFGNQSTNNARTTNDVFIKIGANDLTLRIVRRINHMTGFKICNTDDLDVMNYGMGGHYYIHYDYFDINRVFSSNQTSARAKEELTIKGDRIATILFYLNDVDQGGATVFPRIQQSVFPKRGTALLWYNLHHDGQVDPLTLHAGCPVIVGSKWVMTMWIREREQVFIRPCLKQ